MTAKHKDSNSSINIPSLSSWGLDNHSLDKWLEDDLKESTLYKQTALHKYKDDIALTTDKHTNVKSSDPTSSLPSPNEERLSCFEQSQQHLSAETYNTHSVPSTNSIHSQQLIPHGVLPLLKIYSLLNSIQLQQQQQQAESASTDSDCHKQPPQGTEQSSSTKVKPQIIPLIQPPSSVLQNYMSNSALSSLLPSPVLSVENESIKNNCLHNTRKGKRSRQNSDTNNDFSTAGDINTVLLKRQRNTDAARRSRLRKVIKMETLEKRVETLKTDNEQLKVKLAVLESEVSHTTEKEKRNRQRIQQLEAQLSMAHKQLVNGYQTVQIKGEEKEKPSDSINNLAS